MAAGYFSERSWDKKPEAEGDPLPEVPPRPAEKLHASFWAYSPVAVVEAYTMYWRERFAQARAAITYDEILGFREEQRITSLVRDAWDEVLTLMFERWDQMVLGKISAQDLRLERGQAGGRSWAVREDGLPLNPTSLSPNCRNHQSTFKWQAGKPRTLLASMLDAAASVTGMGRRRAAADRFIWSAPVDTRAHVEGDSIDFNVALNRVAKRIVELTVEVARREEIPPPVRDVVRFDPERQHREQALKSFGIDLPEPEPKPEPKPEAEKKREEKDG